MEIEVSKKVRAAIKAKLLELGVHVDEELPDYVMVLIANRRSKVQMEQDLNLFLGDNTTRFVIWLNHVLKKLDEVTAHLPAPESKKRKSSVEEASSSKKSKPVEDKSLKEKEDKDADNVVVKGKSVEATIVEEPEKSLEKKETRKSESDDGNGKTEKKEHQSHMTKDKHSKKEKVKEKDKEKEKEKVEKKEKSKHAKKDDLPLPAKEQKITRSNFKFKLKSSKIIGKSSIAEEEEDKSLKLTLLDAENDEEFISLNVNSNEFEFDELENLRQVALESQKKKSEEKTKLTEKVDNADGEENDLAVVEVKELSKSPEKPKLVESVEKTDKSPKKTEKSERSQRLSSRSEKNDRFYKPPRRRSPETSDRSYKSPKKSRDRSSDKSDRRESRRGKSPRKTEDVKLKRLKSVIKVEVEPPPKKIRSQVIKKEEEYDPLKPVISTKKLAVNNLILKAVAEAQKSVTEFAILEIGKRKPSIKDRLGSFDKEPYSEEDLKKIVIKVPTSPKPKERISIRVDSTEESTSDEEYEIIEEIVEEEQTKESSNVNDTKEKETKEVKEKNKPIVNIESSPKVILKERPLQTPVQTVKPLKLQPMVAKEQPQCKYWPTCTFKEKCIYPHPKCKFGSKCTKLDCAYKHDKDVCKFFPNCHSLSCSFFHPSPCRFGNGCKDPACKLYHPGRTATTTLPAPTNFHSFTNSSSSFNAVLPARNLLKWKKN